jgi:hypothetical protein
MGGRDVALPGEMRSASHARTLPLVLGWLFGGRAVNEVISTQVYFTANPETIWNRIAFYEEVPGHPSFSGHSCRIPCRQWEKRPRLERGSGASIKVETW